MLFNKAEEIVYNFVHPNNKNMIRFFRAKGYTILNMIEIRKPYEGEKLTTVPVYLRRFPAKPGDRRLWILWPG